MISENIFYGKNQYIGCPFKTTEKNHSLLKIMAEVDNVNLVDAKQDAGAFMGCILLRNNSPFEKTMAHDIEAFGIILQGELKRGNKD